MGPDARLKWSPRSNSGCENRLGRSQHRSPRHTSQSVVTRITCGLLLVFLAISSAYIVFSVLLLAGAILQLRGRSGGDLSRPMVFSSANHLLTDLY